MPDGVIFLCVLLLLKHLRSFLYHFPIYFVVNILNICPGFDVEHADIGIQIFVHLIGIGDPYEVGLHVVVFPDQVHDVGEVFEGLLVDFVLNHPLRVPFDDKFGSERHHNCLHIVADFVIGYVYCHSVDQNRSVDHREHLRQENHVILPLLLRLVHLF